MLWFEALPPYLQQNISVIVDRMPEAQQVFDQLYEHILQQQQQTKRQKPNPSPNPNSNPNPNLKEVEVAKHAISYKLDIKSPVSPSETIFQLLQISFQSPLRKKLNLVFHLVISEDQSVSPQPVFSICNPNTNIPEISVGKLELLIKLCMILPILESLMTSKKNLAMLFLLLNDGSDPIICQLNFDLIKTQLIEAGKIPPPEPKSKPPMVKKEAPPAQNGEGNAESESESESESDSEDESKIMNDSIIDFFQRQFQLFGIELINYVPSANHLASSNKNTLRLDHDSGISIGIDGQSDLFVMVEAYKGSKAGSLLLMAPRANKEAHIIFGFKKPVLIFSLSQIKHVSYVNITRLTFSLLITINGTGEKEDNIELGMIDQKYYSALDSFIKAQRINDNSFDEELREKVKKDAETVEAGEEGDAEASENGNIDRKGETTSSASGLGSLVEGEVAQSDDEEEDGTYHVGMEEDDSDIGSGSNDDSDDDDESDVSGVEAEEDEDEDEDEEQDDQGKHT